MATEWFCKIMGEEWGPMSAQELIAVARRGRLTRDDNVKRGDQGTWVRAEVVRGLFNSPPIAATVTSDRLVAAVQRGSRRPGVQSCCPSTQCGTGSKLGKWGQELPGRSPRIAFGNLPSKECSSRFISSATIAAIGTAPPTLVVWCSAEQRRRQKRSPLDRPLGWSSRCSRRTLQLPRSRLPTYNGCNA